MLSHNLCSNPLFLGGELLREGGGAFDGLEQKGLLWVLVQLSQLNRQKGLGLDLELLNLLLPLFLLGEVVVRSWIG